MINYKVYAEIMGKKEKITTKYDVDSLFDTLDNIINSTPNKLLLVVKYDEETDTDDFFLSYYGNKERYDNDKERLIKREHLYNQKRELELLKQEKCVELKKDIINLYDRKR